MNTPPAARHRRETLGSIQTENYVTHLIKLSDVRGIRDKHEGVWQRRTWSRILSAGTPGRIYTTWNHQYIYIIYIEVYILHIFVRLVRPAVVVVPCKLRHADSTTSACDRMHLPRVDGFSISRGYRADLSRQKRHSKAHAGLPVARIARPRWS